MDQDSPMPVPPPPPVPVIDYDTPRADQVSRGKYVALLVVAAVLGALLLGIVGLRMARQPRVVAMAVAKPPVPAPTPAPVNVAAQVQAARNSGVERRLAELLNNRLGPQTIVYEEEPVAA